MNTKFPVCHSEHSEESTRPPAASGSKPWVLRCAQNDRKGGGCAGPVRGFTLLEVLVALMIFALAAVVLGSAYVNVLNSYMIAARSNQTDEDVAFARSQMLLEPNRELVEAGGEFESTNNRRVKWSATIVSTTINDLFTVTFVCEITDAAKPDPEKVTQTFTVLRPTWSDPAERGQLLIEVRSRIAELQGKKRL